MLEAHLRPKKGIDQTNTPSHSMAIQPVGDRSSRSVPISLGQLKYLVIAIEYSTRWIEAEPLAMISARNVQKFVWKNIICHFSILKALVFDNGT